MRVRREEVNSPVRKSALERFHNGSEFKVFKGQGVADRGDARYPYVV